MKKEKLKAYTVFLDVEGESGLHPPYWVRVKAASANNAVEAARIQASEDFGYRDVERKTGYTFALLAIFKGLPSFTFRGAGRCPEWTEELDVEE